MEKMQAKIQDLARLSLPGQPMLDEVEGELKRIKSFFSSQKDHYRLKYPYMMVRRVLKSG